MGGLVVVKNVTAMFGCFETGVLNLLAETRVLAHTRHHGKIENLVVIISVLTSQADQ
jgi:hypothetical protein